MRDYDYPYAVVSSNFTVKIRAGGYYDRDKAQARAEKEALKAHGADPKYSYEGTHWPAYVYHHQDKVFSAYRNDDGTLATFTAEACGLRSL
jgi:hypothetical protein